MSSDNGRRIVSRSFDPALGELVEWFWLHRLAKHAFNLIIGDGKVGKGTWLAWLIGQANRGNMNGGRPCVGGVIGYEDSWPRVWIPRLSKAGARKGMVYELRGEKGRQINLREDMDLLVHKIKKLKIEILCIDQVLDNLSLTTDSHVQKQVRDDLSPLQILTEEAKVTVTGSMHPNKRATTYREWQSGSSAFSNVARQSLGVFKHPVKEDERVIVVARSNYGEEGHAMSFKISSGEVMVMNRFGRQVRGTTQYIDGDLTPCSYMVEDLIGTEGPRRKQQLELESLMTSILTQNGPVRGAVVIDTCVKAGHGADTVRRRAKDMGVRQKAGMWSLG